MAELVVMSGSSLATFLRCPQQWELAYVHRIRRPPRLRMAVGLAAHSAIEKNLRHKMQVWTDLPKEEVIETFVDEFKRDAQDSPDEGKETKGNSQDSGIATLGVWYDQVNPQIQPLAVEQHGQFTLNGIPYDWTADVVTQQKRIRDWKFSLKKPSGDQYIVNMIGYAIGWRHESGEIESGVDLDYMVRTKQPYHHNIPGSTVPDEAIDAFTRALQSAYKSINAGIYPPTGLSSGVCSWCAYSDGTCPAYRRA